MASYGILYLFPPHPQSSTRTQITIFHELRFGRDNFHEAGKMVRRLDKSQIDWTKFKYMVYDVPNQPNTTYAERYDMLGVNIPFLKYHS